MPVSTPLRLLFVEDMEEDTALVTVALKRAGYAVAGQRVTTAAEMQAALRDAAWDAVIADHTLPAFSAPAALAVLQQVGLDLPFIIVSGTINEVEAVTSLRAGAHDFVTKGNLARLAPALERELREAENRRQHRQAEAALRETEARFAQVWETTSDALALSDTEGLILAANPAYYALYGFTPGQVLGQTFAIVFPEEQRAQAIEQYKGVFANPEPPGIFESAVRRGDGTERFIESRASFITNAGQRTVMLSTIRDVTERKQAEEALRQAEAKYRTLIEQIPAITYVAALDETSSTLYISPQIEKLGYTAAEHLADPSLWARVIHPDDRERVLANVTRTTQTSQPLRSEYRVRHRAGRTFWIRDEATVVTDAAGQPLFIQGVMMDITERKQAEARIQRQVEYLTALRDIDRAIISSFDLNLSLTLLLAQVTARLGVDAAAILVFNEVTQMLEQAAARGFRPRANEHARLRLGEGYAGRAALERRLLHVPDLRAQGDNPRLAQALATDSFASYYAVPLLAKGQVRGVLEVFQRPQPDGSAAGPAEPEWLDFMETLAGQAAIAIDNAALFANLQRSNLELALAYDATIEGWSRALDLRDKETEGHSRRVTELTLRLAEAMSLGADELAHIRRGALLHDMGKLGVPDHILLKPDLLTTEEWVVMRQHPTFAYELLSPISFLRPALDIPYCHHEKWDGTGYPRKLKGEQIPLAARLFSVVDVWDALSSDRPYRSAWSKDRVLAHIRLLAGSAFDPRVVEAFLSLIA